MSKANHLSSMATRLLANLCLARVAAVIGATTSAVTTTGTGAATVGGFMVAITAQTNLALSALAAADLPLSQAGYRQPSGREGFYTQPAGVTCFYVLGVTGAGAWKVVQGTFDPIPAGQSAALDPMQVSATGGLFPGYAGNGRSVIPDVPAEGFTPVTVMKVVTAGAAFVPATTALTSIATFKDVGVLPVDQTF